MTIDDREISSFLKKLQFRQLEQETELPEQGIRTGHKVELSLITM
jgi:hypothetical protein